MQPTLAIASEFALKIIQIITNYNIGNYSKIIGQYRMTPKLKRDDNIVPNLRYERIEDDMLSDDLLTLQ